MANRASARFWRLYEALPPEVQVLADKNFGLFKSNPSHASLHFKRVGRFWSARVGAEHRALAIDVDDGLLWVWIGAHDEYDRLIRRWRLKVAGWIVGMAKCVVGDSCSSCEMI